MGVCASRSFEECLHVLWPTLFGVRWVLFVKCSHAEDVLDRSALCQRCWQFCGLDWYAMLLLGCSFTGEHASFDC